MPSPPKIVKADPELAKRARLEWLGSQMRRSGVEDSRIQQVLLLGGRVAAWGSNEDGQTQVPVGLSNIVAVAAGGYHTLALNADGCTVAWGARSNVSVNYDQSLVPPAAMDGVVAVAAGLMHSVALRFDGTIVAWGQNQFGQTSVPEHAQGKCISVVAGERHTIALLKDGSIVAWGLNDKGQAAVPKGLTKAVAMAAGCSMSACLLENGDVVAWGQYLDTRSFTFAPIFVPAGVHKIVAIAAGCDHLVALDHLGTVHAWGKDKDGQVRVPKALNNVVAVAAGGNTSLALKRDGSVIEWGLAMSAQKPSGQAAGTEIVNPKSGALAIAAGKLDHCVSIVSPSFQAAGAEGEPRVAVAKLEQLAGAADAPKGNAPLNQAWSGTWHNRKHNTSGQLTCTIIGEQNGQWLARFTGIALGKPIGYTTLMTPKASGANTALSGTTKVDGFDYQWSGTVAGKSLNGNYKAANGNNGEFRLLADGNVLAEAEKRSVENQKERAMDGSDLAQYELGMRHLAGEGVELNVPEGIRLLKSAAAAGNAKAARHLDVERSLSEGVPRLVKLGEAGAVSTTASNVEFTLPPITQRPLAKFDVVRFANARELMTRSFSVGMEEFVRSGSALFDRQFTSGWGANFVVLEAGNHLPAKPSYLLGAFANSPKSDDGILWRTCYGIQAGTNSARLIQVELASGAVEGNLNRGYPGALGRNVKSCLTSLGLVRLADAENWTRSAVSSELAPLFQMKVKSADPTLTTDGTLRLFSEKFDGVKLVVRTYEHAYLRSKIPVLNNEPQGREVLIMVYGVPSEGKVYLKKTEYGGYLLRLPPELKNQFADLLDL